MQHLHYCILLSICHNINSMSASDLVKKPDNKWYHFQNFFGTYFDHETACMANGPACGLAMVKTQQQFDILEQITSEYRNSRKQLLKYDICGIYLFRGRELDWDQ